MSSNKAQKIGVAVDGSQLSEQALKAGCALFNAARQDSLIILHVDSGNSSSSRHLQPAYLKSKYEALAQDMRVSGQAEGEGSHAPHCWLIDAARRTRPAHHTLGPPTTPEHHRRGR